MAQHPTPQEPASYPRFHPHITLCSVPSATTDPLTLREAIPLVLQRAIPIRFASLETGTHYFRSVYVAVRPSDALAALHAHIHAVLGTPPATPAFPHMSLYYIGDADAAQGERERMRDDLVSSGAVLPDGPDGGIVLDCGCGVDPGADADSPTIAQLLSGFSGTEIWLVDCDGPVEKWERLDRLVPVTAKTRINAV